MKNPTQALPQHHKHCDELFAIAEGHAHAADWDKCKIANDRFCDELEAHFATEEEIVFPAFEAATGMSGGPPKMMRVEHAQMRDLAAQLRGAVEKGDKKTFAGVADTLLIMMQQHNMKEENILYPMCDDALAGQKLDVDGALRQRLESLCQG